ncbi:MAG: hypothetical protein M1837_002160 [Sclerophora amabilis]|nr:MAG: hypothetical protein M1837_002160 [Sclerophora amabilis]
MGKRGGKKFGRGRGAHRSAPRRDYTETVKQNEKYERYYDELGIVDDEERESFWATLRTELPNSFRFAGSKGHALAVQKRLIDHYIPEITKIDRHDGEKVEAPFPIPWYPDQLAWAMTTPKNIIRRHPPFASFQKFLVSETSVGNISRQEAVSMIPPLLMDIKSGMTVLDLCAAPGSKATQLLEMLHNGEEARIRQIRRNLARKDGRDISPDGFEVEVEKEDIKTQEDWEDDGRSTGLLIANDSDYKRSHLLVHQLKRLNSPNLLVTNHDATMYPSIRLPSKPTSSDRPHGQYLKFDRILADVPCSGDGTIRKNPTLWRDWNPANALGLHATQVRILVRALQMLKVGGRVVYSTCSMNPVENEAVIASAVDRCGGNSQVRIVDCGNELSALQRRPGLGNWKVTDKTGRLWSSWQEVEEARGSQSAEGLERLSETMFPPSVKAAAGDGSSHDIPLERCMRIYAHLQNTGAFFIAVLEKVTQIKARPEAESKKIAPKPPITAIVEELAAKPENGAAPDIKIEALDDVVPPNPDSAGDPSSATARQNKENAPNEVQSGIKRPLDEIDEADAAMATKRLRTREEPDEAAPVGEEDRQVHWPPPPGAQIDPPVSRPARAPRKRGGQPFEEPFKYLSSDHEELQHIYDTYQLSPRFPRNRFMVRNATGEPVKTIYYTTELARNILNENEGQGIKFVHCGVKMFIAQDVQQAGTCKWRIQTEGMPLLESWVGEDRVIRLYHRETLRKLLIEMFPKVGGGGWTALGEIGERVKDIECGCYVLRIETSDEEDGFK